MKASFIVNQKQRKQIEGIYRIKAQDDFVFEIDFYNRDTEFCMTEDEIYKILDRIE